MSYTANDPKSVREAIVTRLSSSTGKSIGEANAPSSVTTPYGVFYPLPDQDSDGSLTDPDSDVWWEFQVTGIGADLDEAQWMQNKIREAMLGWTPTVSGLSLSPVELTQGSGVLRDDDVKEPLFYSTDRFRVHSAPS